ncbi:MAG: FtsX-like permease family protein [Ignavibacteriaceae bacterium]|nr:FtsX-like permease family protein [Ignavibacteriaceae bacterium]
MLKILDKSSITGLLKNPVQTFIAVIGVAIGVFIALSVDIANESSGKAFQLSVSYLKGESTHQIINPAGNLPVDLYVSLRRTFPKLKSAPVIENEIKLENGTKAVFIGIDPFRDSPFRNLISFDPKNNQDLSALYSVPGAVFISEGIAANLGVNISDSISFICNGKLEHGIVFGILKNKSGEKNYSFENIIVTDISNAQHILGVKDQLTRIDIKSENLPVGFADFVSKNYPQTWIVQTNSATEAAESMTKAFKQNLFAMSLLAMIVGLFLIYSTINFLVVKRGREYTLMRLMGVTQKEIKNLVLNEVFFIAALGTSIGLITAISLSTFFIEAVSSTISDLYYSNAVSVKEVSVFSIVKALLIGLLTPLIAGLFPAGNASKISLVLSSRRSLIDSTTQKSVPVYTRFALLCFIVAGMLLYFAGKIIFLSYFAALLVIIGFGLLTPFTVIFTTGKFLELTRERSSTRFRLAISGLKSHLKRTVVSLTALAVAVAAFIGVATMISGFRTTVVTWLEDALKADIFVSAPSIVSRRNVAVLDKEILMKLSEYNGVKYADFYSELEQVSDSKIVNVFGAKINPANYSRFKFLSGGGNKMWDDYVEGKSTMVTETFAFNNNLKIGDSIFIGSQSLGRFFQIGGIYYDYSSENGHAAVDFDVLESIYGELKISGIGLYLNNPESADKIASEIKSGFNDIMLNVRTNKEIKDYSIAIFDRTFIIANLLQFFAVVVAFIGIFSSLTAIQLENGRELATYRALGFTKKDLFKLINYQNLLKGLLAGLLSIPLGLLLSFILIFVINKNSFGWTLQFKPDFLLYLQAILVSVFSAFIAGIYPAVKMAKVNPAEALKDED